MIGWLQSIDVSLFKFCNASLSNPFFDRLMPFVSDSPLFACLLLAALVWLMWRGGPRGRLCALMLLLTFCIGNWLVCGAIKTAVARPRPFQALTETILRVGKGGSDSMPSSHAANWFAAAMVFLIYYRRSAWALVPMAFLVSFSRIYNGVHYPSDVIAGGVLGAGYGAAIVLLCDALWQYLGPRWFPLWKTRLPSLLQPVCTREQPDAAASPEIRDAQWLRLGYVLSAFLLLIGLTYLAAGKIELSADEAYQWLWSKHPALSYYSKPPLIALAQFAGTHLWGDNEFGIRFFSPLIVFVLSILVLRFMGRAAGGRTAFILLLIMNACPLLALGSIVMTVDPLSVLFWTAALIVGWRASGPAGTTRQWLWTGLWMGLGFLSKPTNLFQFVCWAVFFLGCPPARMHLRRRGPWLALLIVAVCSLPVVIWNAQHNWIMVSHVASDGKLGVSTDRSYTLDFLLTEAGVLNPVFFLGALWAAIAFWGKTRREPLPVFLFSMGAPLFLMYFALSFHSRIEPNWIAPSIVPLFCLMALYWPARWKPALQPILAIGIGVGVFAVVLAHDTQLINKLIHRRLPARLDVMRRALGWKETARIVDQARRDIEADGKPAFVICEHYGMTSEISFYSPEAKRRVRTEPMVYSIVTAKPENQFYYWPNYLGRAGQNAIYVREVELPKLRPGWFSRWWRNDPDIYANDPPPALPPPAILRREFQTCQDLGIKNVVAEGNVVRRLQLFECVNLRP